MGPHKRVPRSAPPGVLFQRESRREGRRIRHPLFRPSLAASSRAWPTREGVGGGKLQCKHNLHLYTEPRARVHVVRWGRWSRIAFLSFPFRPTSQSVSSLFLFSKESRIPWQEFLQRIASNIGIWGFFSFLIGNDLGVSLVVEIERDN